MPIEQETISPSKDHNGSNSQLLHGKRVVICEDEAVNLMHLRHVMKRAGLTIAGEAANGEDGLKITLKERPDIVLTDINMPVMDGFEAARRILEAYRPCIIILTGYMNEELKAQAAALGIHGYVVKPVYHDTLIPAVADALDKFRTHNSII